MTDPQRPSVGTRLGGATMMAAGLLFISLWASNRSSSVHLIAGGLLVVAGILIWRRGSTRPPQ